MKYQNEILFHIILFCLKVTTGKNSSGKDTDSEGVHNSITQELLKNSKHMLVYRQLLKSYLLKMHCSCHLFPSLLSLSSFHLFFLFLHFSFFLFIQGLSSKNIMNE